MRLVGQKYTDIVVLDEPVEYAEPIALSLGRVVPNQKAISISLTRDGVPYGTYSVPLGPVGEEELLKALLELDEFKDFSVQ